MVEPFPLLDNNEQHTPTERRIALLQATGAFIVQHILLSLFLDMFSARALLLKPVCSATISNNNRRRKGFFSSEVFCLPPPLQLRSRRASASVSRLVRLSAASEGAARGTSSTSPQHAGGRSSKTADDDSNSTGSASTRKKNKKQKKLGEENQNLGKAPTTTKQKRKDPGSPKQNASAYLLFSNAAHAKLRAANPGLTFGEVVRAIAQQWWGCTS